MNDAVYEIIGRVSKADTLPAGAPHGWIQWKGTDVCMDTYCGCGYHGHIDADFAYWWKCPKCGQVYAVGANVRFWALTPEEAKIIEDGNHCSIILEKMEEA